eukprot:SM000093S24384  [mRNA]  locus=s93:46197:47243:+ [translate_table: standard]
MVGPGGGGIPSSNAGRACGRALPALLALLLCAAAPARAGEDAGGDATDVIPTDFKRASDKFHSEKFLDINEERWSTYLNEDLGKVFYFNEDRNFTQWEDPRRTLKRLVMTPEEKRQALRIRLVAFVIPILGVVGAWIARMAWLKEYFPEALNPTKKRRIRVRQNNKGRAPRTRFKVSQDGKGGRSANS